VGDDEEDNMIDKSQPRRIVADSDWPGPSVCCWREVSPVEC